MTKRERKYQRRLYAEFHANKEEQRDLDHLSGGNYFALYREYRNGRLLPFGYPSWFVSFSLKRLSKRMMAMSASANDLADACSTMATCVRGMRPTQNSKEVV